VPADLLYFHAKRLPADIKRDVDNEQVEMAYQAFRKALKGSKTGSKSRSHAEPPVSAAASVQGPRRGSDAGGHFLPAIVFLPGFH
jgi:hypothetical protein